MYVTVNNEQFQVKWIHNPQNKYPEIGTFCSITRVDKNVEVIPNTPNPLQVSYGQCFVSKKDTFNKNKGRKVSLERALQQGFPKVSRLPFWKAYFDMTHEIH